MVESPYVYMLVGVMGIIIIGHWFPSIKNMSSQSMNNINSVSNIEQIPGIDLIALAACRRNGLL